MRLNKNNHLMYCMNIHAGELFSDVLENIKRFSIPIKDQISPASDFALGLRLSALATKELEQNINEFKKFLKDNNLYVVSINGFPYGPFHGQRVKENVYLPDWTSLERFEYTKSLVNILSVLLPENEIGTISTVPIRYGKKSEPGTLSNIVKISEYISQNEKKNGKQIRLALEPEPDCYLDSLHSTTTFFKQLYSQYPQTRENIGVCLDTCHTALEFESPLQWLEALESAGVSVNKIQVSSALRVNYSKEKKPLIEAFNDGIYLHQTRIKTSGGIVKYKDLPQAISEEKEGEWRIHFHVPLCWQSQALSSTSDLLTRDFFQKVLAGNNRHLEIETYTYDVFPEPKLSAIATVVSDLGWLQQIIHQSQQENKVEIR